MITVENKPEPGIRFRAMRRSDIPRCAELNRCVGWNQLERDWHRFITLGPDGCFVAEKDGEVVGTVTTIHYQNRFGWVGMVIVDPAMRRCGIGRALLKMGIDHLEEIGVETVKLDATPEGKLLYDTMGFVDEYRAARWQGVAPQLEPNARAQTMKPQDIRALATLDAPIFSADRTSLITLYLQHCPDRCFVVRSGDRLAGYLCGRPGRHAEHIGPWVAVDRDTAEALIHTRLSRCAGSPVFVDTLEPCPDSAKILRKLGFTIQRPFIRMYRGPNNHPGQPKHVYGLSGPELG